MATNGRNLAPTLWRTCRALANRRRLRLVPLFMSHDELTVSAVARLAVIPMSSASEYLRTLNARGLLEARRVGPDVRYRLQADPTVSHADALVEALRTTFRTSREPVRKAFAALTGFTHPRRIAVVQALGRETLPLKDIRRRTGICAQALLRHLVKLERRGYVVKTHELYRCAAPRSPLGKALLALALKA